MPVILLMLAFYIFGVVAAGLIWINLDAEPHGRPSWKSWLVAGLGWIVDVGVASIVAAMAYVVLRGRFSERVFLDAVWERFLHSRGPVIFVVSTAVLGALACRWLRTSFKELKENTMPRRWVIAFSASLVTTIVLHLCFVERGSGRYVNGEPPMQAWFGVVGELRHTAHVTWIGPRQFATEHRDLVCLAGGMLTPAILLGAAAFSLFRGFRDARAGKETRHEKH